MEIIVSVETDGNYRTIRREGNNRIGGPEGNNGREAKGNNRAGGVTE